MLGFLRDQAHRRPDAPAIYSKPLQGDWCSISRGQLWSRVTHLAAYLKQSGVAKGDRLAIIAPTSLEWEVSHLAAMLAGGIVIGLDGHDTAERMQKVLENAAVNVLIVKDVSILNRLGEVAQQSKFVVLLSGAFDDMPTSVIQWDEIFKDAQLSDNREIPLPHGDEPATIIYTSGTTGEPKGILYTHGQMLLACQVILGVLPGPAPDARFICWLPLSNLFQRIMNQCALMTGSSLYMVADPLKVLEFVAQIRPDIFIGVPRFFEKLANGIKTKVASGKGMKGAIARSAMRVGARRANTIRNGATPSVLLKLQHRMADRLVLRRLRGLLGDRLQYLISGSAPSAPWVLEFFHSIGWLVLEAYGLSENILPMAMNTPNDYRFGTVGKLLPQNEIQFDSDGEVMVKSPGLFKGYYGDPDSFARVSDNGYYRTGDYGVLDDAGFLRLTGRKSEIIKTSAGRRIALPPIESTLREVSWVDHAVVLGSGRKCLAVLLTVDQAALPGTVLETVQLRHELLVQIGQLARHEQPAAAIIIQRPFSVDGGELTPNLKLRRMEIERKYKPAIERLYAKLDALSGEPATDQFFMDMHA